MRVRLATAEAFEALARPALLAQLSTPSFASLAGFTERAPSLTS